MSVFLQAETTAAMGTGCSWPSTMPSSFHIQPPPNFRNNEIHKDPSSSLKTEESNFYFKRFLYFPINPIVLFSHNIHKLRKIVFWDGTGQEEGG